MHGDPIDLQLALGRAPQLTGARLRDLAACAGVPVNLQALYERSPQARRWLRAVDTADISSDREFIERDGISLVDMGCAGYPPQLLQIPDPPALLYVQGNPTHLRAPQLAMVGTRTPSAFGRRAARDFAEQLSRIGLTITSGLAVGIDAASHEGALSCGARTVAVLGCGLDQIYPRQHSALAARIARAGALVSEFPPGSPPLKHHFPRRNRIISGLSLGLLVVEAARDSGSLITARLAADQGREVFAIPGSIQNPVARGCHALIRAGAKLVEEAADVLEELKFIAPKQVLMEFQDGCANARARLLALDKEYKILLDALGFESVSFDVLAARTGFPSQSVASMLLILELEGAVGLQAGGQYVRL